MSGNPKLGTSLQESKLYFIYWISGGGLKWKLLQNHIVYSLPSCTFIELVSRLPHFCIATSLPLLIFLWNFSAAIYSQLLYRFIIIIEPKTKHVLRLSSLYTRHGPTNHAQTVSVQLGSFVSRYIFILNLVFSIALDRNLNDYLKKKNLKQA